MALRSNRLVAVVRKPHERRWPHQLSVGPYYRQLWEVGEDIRNCRRRRL